MVDIQSCPNTYSFASKWKKPEIFKFYSITGLPFLTEVITIGFVMITGFC